VVEDPSYEHGIAEERHHLHAPAALAAEQSVEEEHAVEELGPTQTTAAAGGVRADRLGSGLGGRRLDPLGEQAWRGLGQARAQLAAIGENAMVSHHLQSGSGHEGGQPSQELEGLQHQMGHAL
jgi:hypothetical protein